MKKLIALIGAVATAFGLYATDLTKSAVSFEATEAGCSGDTLNLEEDAMWSTDYDDVFKFGAVADEAAYYDYDASGHARRATEFPATTQNGKFLKLSTGTNSLQRLYTAGGAEVDTDPIFVDQLVKFTGYEDTQTVFAAGTKVAVWMSEFVIGEENDVEITQTNLYVAVGTTTGTAVTLKNVKIDGEYKLDTWYRLTIRSIGNIIGNPSSPIAELSGFAIYIDGNPITIVPEDRDLLNIVSYLIPKAAVLYSKGQLFPSMIAGNTTLKSVGFQGMGAIDDMIVDAVGPDFAQEANFKFANITGAKVLCVSNMTEGTELIADANGFYTAIPDQSISVYFTANGPYVLKPDPLYKDFTAEAGNETVEFEDIEPEDAIMTVDEVYYAESTLDDAFAVLATGNHDATFLDDVSYEFTVEETKYNYSFAADSTLTTTVAEETGAVTWEIEGEFGTDFDVEANKEIIVYGTTTLLGEIAVAGTLQTDAIYFDTAPKVYTITLDADGKVITKDELTYENFGLEKTEDLTIAGPDGDGYITYTLAAGVAFTVTDETANTATYKVYVDDKDVTDNVPALLAFGQTYKVVATAADNYAYEVEGKSSKTLEITGTAGTDPITVTVPAATAAKVQKGGMFFITLQDALDAAGDDDVVLCDNVTADGVSVGTAYPKTYALDMAGYTLTVSEGATLTLNDAVTLKNSVAGQGGFLNAGTIAINADQDFSNLAWGAGGFISAPAATTAKLAIAADATVKMPTATVEMNPNEMAEFTPGFWDGTVSGAKVFTAANMWKYNGETWDAAVATVAGEYCFTVADALAAVQAAEDAGTFPISVVALQDNLVIAVGEGEAQQSITLAKGGEITVKADSWEFNPAPAITKVVLAEGKKLVFPTAIPNYKTVILCADGGFQVVETALDGGFEYTVEALPTAFFPTAASVAAFPEITQDGSAANPWLITCAGDLEILRQAVAANDDQTAMNFKQTGNIDMTEAGEWLGIGKNIRDNGNSIDPNDAFKGVYDGNNKKISNVTLRRQKQMGFFNTIQGATIKDLTVENVSFVAGDASCGGAMIVGTAAPNSTLDHCVTVGTFTGITHCAGGITYDLRGPSIMRGCTNNVDIAITEDKVAGLVVINNGSDTDHLIDCCNNGDISTTCAEGAENGIAGLFGYLTNTDVDFVNCVNNGTVSGSHAGSIVGIYQSSRVVTATGVVDTANPSLKSVGFVKSGLDLSKVSGLTYATVNAGVATFVDTLVKDTEYVQYLDDASTTIFTLAEKDDYIAFKKGVDTVTLPTAAQIAVADTETLEVTVDPDYTAGIKFVAAEVVSDITITVKKVAGIDSVTVDGKALVFDETTDEATFTVPADTPTATLTLAAVSTIKIPVYTISEGKDSTGWMVTNKTPVVTADAEKANYFTFAAKEASTEDPAITDAAAATAIKEAAPAVAEKVDALTTGDGAIGGKALVNWIATKGDNDPATALAGNYVKASVALDVAPITESTVVKVDTVEKATSDLAVTIKVGGIDATKEQIESYVEVCDDLGAANDWEKLPQSTLKQAVTISEDGKLVITPVAGIDKLFLKVVIPADAK